MASGTLELLHKIPPKQDALNLIDPRSTDMQYYLNDEFGNVVLAG
jgi:hypothetical protein